MSDARRSETDRLRVAVADITALDVDIIVNAANEQLARGGGVCGAIFRAAGPELDAACAALAPCPTGSSRLTPGYAARARWIVHSVGPVWNGGANGEDALLASAYRSALEAAASVDAASLAFPAISTGIYGFPFDRAASIATKIVCDWIDENASPDTVTFAFLSADEATLYRGLLALP